MTAITTPRDALADFAGWIVRTRYQPTSQAAYLAKVTDFVKWIEAQPGHAYDECMVNEHVRDFAVRDYRRHLLVERKQSIATVELAMTAVATFYKQLGLGKPDVTREDPKRVGETRGLAEPDLRKVLRGAERDGVRSFALAMTLFGAGTRVSEAAALDLDDVFMTDRMGYLVVRYGKGGKPREVDLGADVRAALRPWIAQRHEQLAGQPRVGAPLFVARGNVRRLSVRSIQRIVGEIGEAAGVDCSPHVLRHSLGRRWIEKGGDLVGLRDTLGHSSLQTTAIYADQGRDSRRRMADTVGLDL